MEKSISKLPIVKKAFRVWHEGMLDSNRYGWFEDLPIYYAETPSQAKSMCSELGYYTIDGEHHKFTDIKVKRVKSNDVVLFEGENIVRYEVDYKIKVRERDKKLDELLLNNPDGYAYILKGGYYYRPNCAGYTDRKSMAGVYPLRKAVSEVKRCSLGDHMRVILIDVTEHNEMVQKEIDDLETRIIENDNR